MSAKALTRGQSNTGEGRVENHSNVPIFFTQWAKFVPPHHFLLLAVRIATPSNTIMSLHIKHDVELFGRFSTAQPRDRQSRYGIIGRNKPHYARTFDEV